LDGWIERHRSQIMFLLGNVILVGAAVLVLRRPPSPQGPVVQIATALPTPSPLPTSTTAPLRVYVSGAVAHPDVYELLAGSIVKDAVTAAGGALPGADLARVNLAQQLHDQQQVHIPLVGETPAPLSSPGQSPIHSPGGGCVDINSATLEELDELPGIGPVYAQRIIEYRTAHGSFQDIEDLIRVKGIGPATLQEIRDLICIR